MADVWPIRPVVFDCRASSAVLDRFRHLDGTWFVRIGSRHALLVGDRAPGPLDGVIAWIRTADPSAMTTDLSSGWSAVVLEGEGGMRSWKRTCARPVGLPGEPWIGAVAGVRSIVLPEPNRITIAYESVYDHHIARELGFSHIATGQKVRA